MKNLRLTIDNLQLTRRVSRLLVYCLLFTVYCLLPSPALAQDEVSDNEVNDVAKDLFCPVCESTPLDVCPTQACADWRELIRQKLSEGQTKQNILDYFALQYGDGVLANPPRRGINLIIWLAPIIAIPLGLLFFGRYLRGLKVAAEQGTVKQAGTAVSAPPVNDYLSRIEKELQDK